MPRHNNRKIPRKEGELGFDPSQYIGKGNTPFPDNYSSDIGTPGDFRPLGDSTVSPRDFKTSCDFGSNIISQTEAMTTTTSTPRQNVYAWNNTKTKRNDTRNKRKKKRPYQYRYYKARRPTKRIHRANAMIRKMRRGADQVIEALRAEEAEKIAMLREDGTNADCLTSATPASATASSNSTADASAEESSSQKKQTLFSKIQKILHSHR